VGEGGWKRKGIGGETVAYEITIRDKWGDKIVRRFAVDNKEMTVGEIIEDGANGTYAEAKVRDFITLHGRDNLKYFWFPDQIPAPPPPKPKPEPVAFETLVNVYSV
jgi:hypothetical protein